MSKTFLEMSAEELQQAKTELKLAVQKQDWLAVARIISEPVDPRIPVDPIIEVVSDVHPPATPDEYLFYYDVDEDTKYVYTIASGGTVTAKDVTVSAPNSVTFAPINSPVYNIHIVDLNNAKFDVIGKKKQAVTRALDNKELAYVLNVLWAGTPAGNQFSLDSGKTYLDFPKILEMRNSISKYGTDFALICGTTVDDDITLTDYRENKNQSVLAMMDKLNIKKYKVVAEYNDGSAKDVLSATSAILVALNTRAGKPVEFGRKTLVQNTVLGTTETTEKLRLLTVTPVVPRGTEKPSVAIWGYGEFQAVLKNSKAVARFTRA